MSVLDLRLVPAAVTAWAVTAAVIAGQTGPAPAVACATVGLSWWLARTVLGHRYRLLRAAGAGVIGAAAVGTGFGVAAGLRSDAVQQHPLAHRFGTTAVVTVTAAESPRATANGRVMFNGDLVAIAEIPAGGRVTVFGPPDFGRLTAGQPARFRARIGKPARRDLTVGTLNATGRPVLGEASELQHAAGSVRARFTASAVEVLPAGQAAILPGLVLGDTAAMTPAAVAEFRAAGLTHLTAVSGANVTIVCGAVLFSAALIGPRAAVLLAGVVLAAFVLVVQPGASVLRAAIMGAITLLALLSARRRQAIPALAATVLVVLGIAPHFAVDAGFALSVVATAALVLLAPSWSARLVGRGWPKPVADAVSVAAAAQLVTAPLIAAISGRFSVVAVVANLLVAVVIPPITVLGTAAAALCPVWPAAAGLLIRFTGPELWWLLAVAHHAGGLPGAAVTVPSGWAGFAMVGLASAASVLLWRQRWFRLAAGCVGLCVLAWAVSGLVAAA